jgi:hypothetical protein
MTSPDAGWRFTLVATMNRQSPKFSLAYYHMLITIPAHDTLPEHIIMGDAAISAESEWLDRASFHFTPLSITERIRRHDAYFETRPLYFRPAT